MNIAIFVQHLQDMDETFKQLFEKEVEHQIGIINQTLHYRFLQQMISKPKKKTGIFMLDVAYSFANTLLVGNSKNHQDLVRAIGERLPDSEEYRAVCKELEAAGYQITLSSQPEKTTSKIIFTLKENPA